MQTTKQSTFRILNFADLGLIGYEEAWRLQKRLFEKRLKNEIGDTLLLLEHPHTYTLGKAANVGNLLLDKQTLAKRGIAVYEIDRGGDVTYHGPGQIVGYAIINLAEWEKDAHKYLRAIEEAIILTCEQFDVKAGRNPKYTGVWVGENKICAIGIKITRWITMHGFAFNVATDLSLFEGIIPCGIHDKGVTSLEIETQRKQNISEVKKLIVENFSRTFNYGKTIKISNIENLLTNEKG